MPAVRGVDQPRIDARLGPHLADAAFEHVSDTHLGGDVIDGDVLTLERVGQIASDNERAWNVKRSGSSPPT